jgi:o-succinylbenzoate synthase
MNYSFRIIPHTFVFRTPGGTSRGVMTKKKAWFVELTDASGIRGIGECSVIENLTPDYQHDAQYADDIQRLTAAWIAAQFDSQILLNFPSIRFGLETALTDLRSGGTQRLFDTAFTRGTESIRINGLIWMGSPEYMKQQIEAKLAAGFSCLKLKIGAIDWQNEHVILKELRASFPSHQLEIRVDANGAFSVAETPRLLDELAELSIHSIEQPIRAGQVDELAKLCQETPCPIALDEELIGVNLPTEKVKLLEIIQPQFIILKPGLHGGLSGTAEWIAFAEERDINWWITSALESNVGLNAIAQFASQYALHLPQGLGTGQLYTENIPSPLELSGEHLRFLPAQEFDFSLLNKG